MLNNVRLGASDSDSEMAPRWFTRLRPAVALVLLGPVWMCSATSAQPRSPRTALAVHWSSEDYPSNPVMDAAIRRALLAGAEAPLDYFAEYLESDRFSTEEATLAFRDYIRGKYRGRRIDVVLAITDPALQFVLRHRAELFPDAPIVAATSSAPDTDHSDAGLTGVSWRAADAETLELALNLHPSTERVFVVAQALTGSYLAGIQAALAKFAERVELTFISERSVPRLIAAVRALPTRSLVLFIRYSQEDPGEVMFPNEVVRLVAEASPVPVYVSADAHVGTGAVGGVVRQASAIGTRIGEIARRVLDGTPARDIAFEQVPVAPVLDWHQLRRWGIPESSLPAGAVIQFRELSTWERYKTPIIVTLGVVLLQSVLIAGLLVGRRNLRRSQMALRDLAGRLISAREDERTQIARDLHDDIGQRVASLSIALSRVQREVPDAPTPARQSLATLEQQTAQLSADLRQLSHELHPGALEHLGLLEALRERCDDFSEESGVPVRFHVSDEWRDVPPARALCLYRVAQEALRNIATHSRARNVTVSLEQLNGLCTMSVTDDGCGFDTTDPSRRSGLGLVSLSERVHMLGGDFVVTAAPHAGTRIAVSLPTGESHAS